MGSNLGYVADPRNGGAFALLARPCRYVVVSIAVLAFDV